MGQAGDAAGVGYDDDRVRSGDGGIDEPGDARNEPADQDGSMNLLSSRGIGGTTMDLLTRTALEERVPLLQVVQEAAQDPRLRGRACRALQRFVSLQ